jgi:hypothetical protein
MNYLIKDKNNNLFATTSSGRKDEFLKLFQQ